MFTAQEIETSQVLSSSAQSEDSETVVYLYPEDFDF